VTIFAQKYVDDFELVRKLVFQSTGKIIITVEMFPSMWLKVSNMWSTA